LHAIQELRSSESRESLAQVQVEEVDIVQADMVSPPGGWAQDEEMHVKRPQFGEDVRYENGILRDLGEHPHIIGLYGTDPEETELYIEKAELDLYDYIAKMKGYKVPADEVCDIAEAASLALAHMHDKGYAHNDIKVENLVLCSSKEVGGPHVPKLIDFEFTSKFGEVPPEGVNNIAGTKAYFSPEKESEEPDYNRQQADMWAFGVTLHLATYGCFPNGTAEPLPVLQSDFESKGTTSSSLGSLLEGLLKIDPSQRWTAQEVHRHLLDQKATSHQRRIEQNGSTLRNRLEYGVSSTLSQLSLRLNGSGRDTTDEYRCNLT